MKIVVASGKGGTGKTTVTACLTRVLFGKLTVVDLDVEAPNLHLFLKPEITDTQTAHMTVPQVDQALCIHCRRCSEICQFKAIADLGEVLLTFPELCHGCGGCMAVCPEAALTAGRRALGQIRRGYAGEVAFIEGRLRVGEAMSPPLMRAVKATVDAYLDTATATVIFDAPPGVSCPAVNAVMDSDLVVMVTEPTPFGLYDLELAFTAFNAMGLPMAVVVNRSGRGDEGVDQFCRREGLPIVGRIPYERRIAEAYSQGQIPVDVVPGIKAVFRGVGAALKRMAGGAKRPVEVDHA